MDTDEDPTGLANVKELAKIFFFPKSGFNRKVRVNYIMAGPGYGKSFIIRLLADQSDLILSP